MHGVDEEVSGDGLLAGCETHGDHGAAVDTAGARGVPWLAGICEDVLGMVLVDGLCNRGYVSCHAGLMYVWETRGLDRS